MWFLLHFIANSLYITAFKQQKKNYYNSNLTIYYKVVQSGVTNMLKWFPLKHRLYNRQVQEQLESKTNGRPQIYEVISASKSSVLQI